MNMEEIVVFSVSIMFWIYICVVFGLYDGVFVVEWKLCCLICWMLKSYCGSGWMMISG